MIRLPRIDRMGLMALVAALLLALPSSAFAQAATVKCTGQSVQGGQYDAAFDIMSSGGSNGFVSGVAKQISTILTGMAGDMFKSVATGISGLLVKVTTLYVMVYGILFMFGAVSITVWDFLTRALKLAIVASLLHAGSSGQVYGLMYSVFECGTDEMINTVISLMTGISSTANCATDPPLAAVDLLAAKVFSSKMAVTLWATLTAGLYGPVMFLLLALSLQSILMSILQAMWVYLMSKVVRALLFGVAPLFLAALLFQRTRYMFDGWVNQLVNASLQPIFLFAFFTFFVGLMSTAIDKILETPVCITEIQGAVYGAPATPESWRYTVKDGGTYKPYSGAWGSKGANIPGVPEGSQPIFPIPVITVMVFFVVAELASRFNYVVLAIASGIAHSSLNLSQIQGVFSSSNMPAFVRPAPRDSGGRGNQGRTGPPTSGVGARAGTGGNVGAPTPASKAAAAAGSAGAGSSGRTASDLAEKMRQAPKRPGANPEDKK